MKIVFAFLFALFILLACNKSQLNYIDYYNKVNEIDSIYRFANQPILAVKKYKKLFKKYPPKSTEYFREYETFIVLSYKNNIKFGGKKSLIKLIDLIAPYSMFGWEKQYYPIFNKYKMDSIDIKKQLLKWENNKNHILLDSFSNAMIRDQMYRSGKNADWDEVPKQDKKNTNLLKWTFENYGYPSIYKIGFGKDKNNQIVMNALFLHMAESTEYSLLKQNLYKYVKSGDCPPEIYASMIDRYESRNNNKLIFGEYRLFMDDTYLDSVKINANRKSIGLPSLKHKDKLIKDHYKFKNLLK